MFTAAQFAIVKTRKQPKCPLTGEWVKNRWYKSTVKHDWAIKKNKIMPSAATWMDLEIIILSEQSQRATNKYLTLTCSVQFSLVAWSCLTLCDPMDGSTPGLPLHCQLLEFTQTHDHCVGDAIQPSHPLSSPSPPSFSLSQHKGLFKYISVTCKPMDCSPPGSSVHGIFQARKLKWVAMPSSRGSFRSRDQPHHVLNFWHCRQIIYHWATREVRYHSYVESKIWHKRTYLQNRSWLTGIENRPVVAKWEREFGASSCKLLHIEWINNQVLQYSTGDYLQ